MMMSLFCGSSAEEDPLRQQRGVAAPERCRVDDGELAAYAGACAGTLGATSDGFDAGGVEQTEITSVTDVPVVRRDTDPFRLVGLNVHGGTSLEHFKMLVAAAV